MEYQWYPGHMTKARRMMEENIRLVDLVIELVDARIPFSSRNPDIDALCKGKSRIVLLCKADLADPVRTEEFQEIFRKKGILSAAVDARERRAGEIVRRYVQEACSEKLARDRARGIVGRPLRAMVAGIPNVGKSTFINSFAGRASTKTGNKPGVTRGKQWIRLGGSVELLDTPGILWPKFDSQETGMRLALVGAIRDEILDRQELAVWLLEFLERVYPGAVREKYLTGKEETTDASENPDETISDETISDETISDETISDEIISEETISDEIISEETNPDGIAVDETGIDVTDAHGTEKYDVSGAQDGLPEGYLLLLEIARARRLLKKGGEPDALRAAAMVLDDCKNGRIGRISLDTPAEAEAFEKASAASMSAADRSGRKEKAPTAGKKGGRAPAGSAADRSGRKEKAPTAGKKGGRAPAGSAAYHSGKKEKASAAWKKGNRDRRKQG